MEYVRCGVEQIQAALQALGHRYRTASSSAPGDDAASTSIPNESTFNRCFRR
jgi:hypothetical protein